MTNPSLSPVIRQDPVDHGEREGRVGLPAGYRVPREGAREEPQRPPQAGGLFTYSAVCLHFQLIVYLFTFSGGGRGEGVPGHAGRPLRLVPRHRQARLRTGKGEEGYHKHSDKYFAFFSNLSG